MALLVYMLCSLTSLASSVLLLRGYREQRVRLLLWAGLCFAGFALGNILLLVDNLVGAAYDMSLVRSLPVLGGLAVLMYGLVLEA